MADIEMARRNQLIDKIKTINDQNIIDEIYRLLEIDFEDSVYITNKEQKKAIQQARKQIEQGEGISSNEADREVDEWLKK